MKILVVEDDFTSRLLLQEMLVKHGPVVLAEDGTQALEEVKTAFDRNDPFGLICLDIMMPGPDGQAVLHDIREMEADKNVSPQNIAKIVMITALEDPKNIMAAFREQADGYVKKPFDETALLKTLTNLELISA